MKPHQLNIIAGFRNIADTMRGWLPSDVAAECPAALFFIKRLIDLAAIGRLEGIPAVQPEHFTDHYSSFSWLNFATKGETGLALLTELALIEEALPQLSGLSKETRLAHALATRGDMDEQFRKIFARLGELPTADLSAREAAEIFQYLLDTMADRAASSVTPASVRKLLVGLVAAKQAQTIYDPVCGYGSLLFEAAASIDAPSSSIVLAGQELNRGTLVLAQMNALLHDQMTDLRSGDTLISPQHKTGNALQKFDVILANPPFGLRLKAEDIEKDKYDRFVPVAPSSSELAFVQHVVHSLSPKGRAAVLVPNGILFRTGNDQAVRQYLVETNRLEAVVSLPSHLIPGTAIPVSVLVLRGDETAQRSAPIAFIDLSSFADGPTTRRYLTEKAVSEATAILQKRDTRKGVSALVTFGEIAANGFNLSVQRYVRVTSNDDLSSFADELAGLTAAIEQRNKAEAAALAAVRAVKRESP